MAKFHEMLDQLTKRRKLELMQLAGAETNPAIIAEYEKEALDITEFIYCCQACVPTDAPLDKAVIVSK